MLHPVRLRCLPTFTRHEAVNKDMSKAGGKPRMAIATMTRINIGVFRACTEMDISDQYRRHKHRWDRVTMSLNPMCTS